MLPDPTEFLATNWGDVLAAAQEKLALDLAIAMPKLREEVENCPACILAALRQKKIPVPIVDGFDFKAEMQAIFSDLNSNGSGQGYY